MLDVAWPVIGVLSVIYGGIIAFGPKNPQFRDRFTLYGSFVLLAIFLPTLILQVIAWLA